MPDFDLAIIGGGINGVGIARDAAGRGIRVLLIEQNDLASGTSSASTKLIHGGLRYLEHWAFRLVHEALAEREVLLRAAPHIIRPLRFVLPYHKGLRPAWELRTGLFLYDRLGGRYILPATRTLNLGHGPVSAPLKREYRLGFEYSDCAVDDSRLVILNAIDAAARGAVIRTRTRLVRADRAAEDWQLVLNARGHRESATARVLVNATGPWVGPVTTAMLRLKIPAHVRLVKGSHIVVRRLYENDRAYIFQSGDGRVVFAIPYERDFTLIGTTDEDFDGDPAGVGATPQEISQARRSRARRHRPLLRGGAGVDARGAAAGRRFSLEWGRCAGGAGARPVAVPHRRTRAAHGARLRHAARSHPRRCAQPRRSRRTIRRRPHRRRSALSHA